MHFSELTPPEQRVLGCLIEKRWTTPDQYPLSLNALRLAANQSTNRDPVTNYDEATVREAAQRLSRYGLARLASGHSSRATKYRHLAEEALGLGRAELAVLAVLLLRGPQTPGEIKMRSERMAEVGSLDDVERLLGGLSDRGYVRRIARRPGQKEDRFEHLLGGAGPADAPATAIPAGAPAPAGGSASADAPATAIPAGAPAPADAPALGPAGYPNARDDDGAPSGSSGMHSGGEPSSIHGLEEPSAFRRGEPDQALTRRVHALEAEVARLRARLDAIAAELGLAPDDEPEAGEEAGTGGEPAGAPA